MMKNTIKLSLVIATLLSGAHLQATVFAAATLVKDGKTVYLCADVPGASNHAAKQRESILHAAKELNALLIVRDEVNCEHWKPYVDNEYHEHIEVIQQKKLEAQAEKEGVLTNIVAAAHEKNIACTNVDFESFVSYPLYPMEYINIFFKAMNSDLKNQLKYLSLHAKQFWSNVVYLNTLNDKTMIEEISQEDLQKVQSVANTIAGLLAMKLIEEAEQSHIIVCEQPESVMRLVHYLQGAGWSGNAENIVAFNANWQEGICKEYQERPVADLQKKQNNQKKLSKKTQQKLKAKKPAQLQPLQLETMYHQVAGKFCRPVNLTDFFKPIAQAPAFAPASSSQPGCNQVLADACAKMDKIIALQKTTAMSELTLERMKDLAVEADSTLLSIFSLDAKSVQKSEYELAHMQKHAAELVAYFYDWAQEYKAATISYCNALGAAWANCIYMSGTAFPYHAPRTVIFLAECLQVPELTEQTKNIIRDVLCFDEQELNKFIDGLNEWANYHRAQAAESSIEPVSPVRSSTPEQSAVSELESQDLPVVQPEEGVHLQEAAHIERNTGFFTGWLSPKVITVGCLATVGTIALAYKTGFGSWLYAKAVNFLKR